MAQGQTRAQQFAEAYLRVAQVNHYMVGICEVATDDELSEAEQILISAQNSLAGAPGGERWNAQQFKRYDLALDLLQHEQSRRLSAASQGTATRVELDAWQAGVADHDSACAADGEPVHNLNLDCMASPAEVAEAGSHLATLRAYADAKARAMTLRLGGNIAGALALESDCERLYGTLPANWRW